MGIVFDYFSRKILWAPFRVICFALFFLIVVLFPFNSKAATILLFWYISLWSRIPTLVSDFTKDLDVLDFFTVIIAVNLDSIYVAFFAGLFAFSLWFLSRIFGPDEDFAFTISESIAFFFAGFLTPTVHLLTHNILITMFTFTAIRYLGIFIMVAIFFRNHTIYMLISLMAGVPIAITTNKIMVIFLGPFFASAFDTGLRFNFPLFTLGVILTIGAYYIPKYIFKREIEEITIKKTINKPILKDNNVFEDNKLNYPQYF